MSKLVTVIRNEGGVSLVYISVSKAGIEITADPETTFTPDQARDYAKALLTAAALVDSRAGVKQPATAAARRLTEIRRDFVEQRISDRQALLDTLNFLVDATETLIRKEG